MDEVECHVSGILCETLFESAGGRKIHCLRNHRGRRLELLVVVERTEEVVVTKGREDPGLSYDRVTQCHTMSHPQACGPAWGRPPRSELTTAAMTH